MLSRPSWLNLLEVVNTVFIQIEDDPEYKTSQTLSPINIYIRMCSLLFAIVSDPIHSSDNKIQVSTLEAASVVQG